MSPRTMHSWGIVIVLLLAVQSGEVRASSVERVRQVVVHEIARDLPVSPRAVNVSSTPVALCGERVVVVTVEEGEQHDSSRLPTVAHLGERGEDGTWQWQREVIEPRTLPDAYHTQPSVGVDSRNFVHIAYNMHNMPWQYAVSRSPCSIAPLEFRGESVSDAELHQVFEQNQTNFPGIGRAAIPGNQVTYPVFTNDRNGELYVSFRFAVRPARSWLQRAFAAGIARYDADDRTWQPIGGVVSLSAEDARGEQPLLAYPFAWQPGWTSYYPRLWFDADNGMHVLWTWREKEAGADTTRPSYAYRSSSGDFERADGTSTALPVLYDTAGAIDVPGHDTFLSSASVTTSRNGEPIVLLQPVGETRLIAQFDRTTNRWNTEASPYGATSVLCEDNGDCWAYASGPRLLLRSFGSTDWRLVYSGENYCDPKPYYDPRTRRRLLYVTRCDQRSARVLEITG